jgi:phytoene desaturase
MTTTLPPAPPTPRQPGARRPRTVIVGAGFGGLAAAVRLLAQGHDVTILEQQPAIGGRASQIRDGDYTFDTGPSLITMPWLFDEVFAIGGTRLADEVRLHELDPGYRIYWTDDDRWFDFAASRDTLYRETAKFSPADAGNLDAFLEATREIHERGVLAAGRMPFLSPTAFASLVPTMARLNAIRSLRHYVNSYFGEPHVRQVMEFHSLFIGGNPSAVPGIYSALVYLQVADGIWYAEGGVYSVVEALGRLVESGGGRIVTGDGVARIVHDGKRVRGVRTTAGLDLPADIVVSNADVTARERLLGGVPDRLPWRLRPYRTTMSAFLLYLGTNRRFERLLHHTLIVGRDYHGFIDRVTSDRRMPEDFSVYIHAPSRTEPAMAAPGGDSITVLLPVPNLRSGDDWAELEPRLRDRLIDWLETDGGLAGLRDSIVVEHHWTPLTFRDGLGATDGNAFAVEPTLQQSAYFRQPNRDRVIDGLYYVGGGTHPGAGMPGTLLTAEVTANLIAADLAGRTLR